MSSQKNNETWKVVPHYYSVHLMLRPRDVEWKRFQSTNMIAACLSFMWHGIYVKKLIKLIIIWVRTINLKVAN